MDNHGHIRLAPSQMEGQPLPFVYYLPSAPKHFHTYRHHPYMQVVPRYYPSPPNAGGNWPVYGAPPANAPFFPPNAYRGSLPMGYINHQSSQYGYHGYYGAMKQVNTLPEAAQPKINRPTTPTDGISPAEVVLPLATAFPMKNSVTSKRGPRTPPPKETTPSMAQAPPRQAEANPDQDFFECFPGGNPADELVKQEVEEDQEEIIILENPLPSKPSLNLEAPSTDAMRPSKTRYCRKCRNHGLLRPSLLCTGKRIKERCPNEACTCKKCNIIEKKRAVTRRE